MIIRQAQLEVFDREETRKFERRVLDSVRRHWPRHVEGLRDEEVADLIRAGIARAEGYGLKLERHITTYINLSHLYWPDFDERPFVSRVLNDAEHDAGAKIDLLVEDVPKPSGRRAA